MKMAANFSGTFFEWGGGRKHFGIDEWDRTVLMDGCVVEYGI